MDEFIDNFVQFRQWLSSHDIGVTGYDEYNQINKKFSELGLNDVF